MGVHFQRLTNLERPIKVNILFALGVSKLLLVTSFSYVTDENDKGLCASLCMR